MERGSTGSIGLKVSSGCIDSGFRGEWFVALYNANSKPIEITNTIDKTEITEDFIRYPLSKAIAQFCFEEVPVMKIAETDWETLKEFKSDRGEGMLGSSGK
jgi:dUTP pyrophosphatase